MSNYKLIVHRYQHFPPNFRDFEKIVNDYISEGYVCQGGVTITIIFNNMVQLAQAVVKEDEEDVSNEEFDFGSEK